jgi:hypothetical protein
VAAAGAGAEAVSIDDGTVELRDVTIASVDKIGRDHLQVKST